LTKQVPAALLASLQHTKGFDEKAFLQVHQSGHQLVSMRINSAKFDIQHSTFDIDEKVPWSTHGYYLKQRPSFTSDPLFHAGAYYVQEASSMFLEQAIRQTCDLAQSLRVLDLCAAPGGKSTLIQSMISEQSLLVSNEVIKPRANILVENITKWGAANVIVTNNDPDHFKRLPGFFDLIVVDAPCSGSGLFRKDPDAIDEWSSANVALCSQRQQRILADVFDSLKPGGVLIYSTCSYSATEDEDISDWITEHLAADSLRLKVEQSWQIVETNSEKTNAYGYRFYPDKVKGEGFFIAAFKKQGEQILSKDTKPKTRLPVLSKTEEAVVNNYILCAGEYNFIKWKEAVLAFPAALADSFLLLQSSLYFKKAGVKMGTIIRNEFLPDHEWALSTIAAGGFQKIEVDHETALQYLRRKDIEIKSDITGWTTLTYQGISLGLIKILPSRINNYYPKEWRILNR
jgi:NOL1/NOP2/sun family putative RNA methylase